MDSKRRLWDYFVADAKLLSQSAYKKSILRAQLSVLSISVGLAYIAIDIGHSIYLNIPYYIFLIAASIITMVLNKKNQALLANITFLSLLNFLVYIFASSDTYRSGVYTYFIVTSLTALTLCGYEHLKLGLFFVGVSITLFIIGYVFKISPVLPRANFSENYVTVYFTTNFIVSVITVTTLLFFLLNINHQTEKELLQNNELLSKTNQELDRFVYSASHDLRSPLSSILGLVEVAKKSPSQEEVNRCLSLIEDRVKVQDSFIYEIIEYARNARMNLVMERVPVKSLVYEIIDQLMYMKEAGDVEILVNVEEDAVILMDKIRMTSVLSNLIGNAIKYQDKSKPRRFVKIGMSQTPTQATIFVEDNGQGIYAQFHEKIFDMFFRASENSKGSGLGLFIVKETVDKMKGTVSVSSEYGKGSCFTVTLPLLT